MQLMSCGKPVLCNQTSARAEKPFFKKEGGRSQVEHLPASLIIIFKMTDEVDCLKKIIVIFMLTMHIMNKCRLFGMFSTVIVIDPLPTCTLTLVNVCQDRDKLQNHKIIANNTGKTFFP